jgi:hypothetical protein
MNACIACRLHCLTSAPRTCMAPSASGCVQVRADPSLHQRLCASPCAPQPPQALPMQQTHR